MWIKSICIQESSIHHAICFYPQVKVLSQEMGTLFALRSPPWGQNPFSPYPSVTRVADHDGDAIVNFLLPLPGEITNKKSWDPTDEATCQVCQNVFEATFPAFPASEKPQHTGYNAHLAMYSCRLPVMQKKRPCCKANQNDNEQHVISLALRRGFGWLGKGWHHSSPCLPLRTTVEDKNIRVPGRLIHSNIMSGESGETREDQTDFADDSTRHTLVRQSLSQRVTIRKIRETTVKKKVS